MPTDSAVVMVDGMRCRRFAEHGAAGLLREAQLHPGSKSRGLRWTRVREVARQHCCEAGLPECMERSAASSFLL